MQARNIMVAAALLAVVSLRAAAPTSFIGCSADLTTDEFEDRVRTLEMATRAGIGNVRTGFDMREVPAMGGRRDFSRWDAVLEDAARAHVEVLPILSGPKALATEGVPGEWRDFVRDTATHFRGRVKAWEVWNEENIETFWHKPNPTNYLALLKVTYEEIKAADPAARVAIGGFSHVPFGYIEEIYRLGGGAYFDIMNIHPYSRPRPPEDDLERDVEALRALMARYGDATKPIWITEIGWATQKTAVFDHFAWINGLRVARPDKKRWRAIYAAAVADNTLLDQGFARAIQALLPPGSTVEMGTPSQVNVALKEKRVDLVIYPFTRAYPADTIEPVIRFVKEGGTLVKAGGHPLHNGCAFRRRANGTWNIDPLYDVSKDRDRLRLTVTGFWNDPALPISARFFKADRLKPGDRMIPLVTIVDAKGRPAVPAAVYAFDSDYKGRVVVDGYWGKDYHDEEPNSGNDQARFLPRAFCMAAALGVEKCFVYEFRSRERDPWWMENHFGIVSAMFSPKTAYHTLATFAEHLPSGAKMREGSWHDEIRYCPQWILPDGTPAGAVWRLGPQKTETLVFDGEHVKFYNTMGKEVAFESVGKNAFRVRTDEAPLYFTGARLVEGIELECPAGKVVFSEADGGIRDLFVRGGGSVWRTGEFGLWRVKFKDGGWLDAANVPRVKGGRVGIVRDGEGVRGEWETPDVNVTAWARPYAKGVELRASLEPRGDRTVREFAFPATFRFVPEQVERFTVASCRSEGPGISFNRGFFLKSGVPHEKSGRYFNGPDHYRYEVVYPSAFSDFMQMETVRGATCAVYGLQPRPPHEPWKSAVPFTPAKFGCGGDARGGFASHGFILWNGKGETFETPTVRLEMGGTLFDALDGYVAANGLTKPLAAKMPADRLETFKKGLFLRLRGVKAARAVELLPYLPHPFTAHTSNWLRRPQDEAPPDWFPPSESFGGEAGLKALIAALHGRGDLFCPYTNPTFWSDMPPRNPYFATVGEEPLARFENGKPRPEGYTDGNSRSWGWTPCLWHPAVQHVNRKNRDTTVKEYGVDLLFQDQCGSRGWVEDFNAAAPSPLAYTEGILSMVEEDAAVAPLGTEDGWDRVANEEVALFGINGKMMMNSSRHRPLKELVPPGLWRWEAVAARLMHERCVFHFHDLGDQVRTPRDLAWALGCGFALSETIYEDFDGPKEWQARRRAWIRWLDALQQKVASRYAGARAEEFRHDRAPLFALGGDVARRDDDGVITARYGDVRVKANLGGVARTVEGERLAPYGFSVSGPGLRAVALDGEEPYVEADGKRITRADCGFPSAARPDLAEMTCPAIFIGNETTAYRDPAAVVDGDTFFLFFTLVKIEPDGGIYSYTAESESRNLLEWTPPRILTPRDQKLNYSSPGNVVKDGDDWVLCLQTYPRPGNTVSNMPMFANADARIFTMRSKDLRTWSAPELMRVRGPDVAEKDMGRMIDPYLLRDKDDVGKWWCFFKQNGASRAYSRDLKTWTFDGNVQAGENVCVLVKDGEYMMFHSPANGIAVKRSRDLVHWRDEPGLILLGQRGWNWAHGRITAGAVVDARNVPGVGKYVMFFHGSGPKKETEGDFDRNASIGLAWSDDLAVWAWPRPKK